LATLFSLNLYDRVCREKYGIQATKNTKSTILGMLSHLLSFFLIGAVQVLNALWGGIVSVKSLPPGEKKRLHQGVFVALGVLGLVLTFWAGMQGYQTEKESIAKQEKTDAVQNEIVSLLHELGKAKELTLAEQMEHAPVSDKPQKKVKAVGLQPITSEQEIARRQGLLTALRNEYILSHDGISPALMAGTEQPPSDWVNKRLRELGENWTVSIDPKTAAKEQLNKLLADGRKLYQEGCSWLTHDNGKETAPLLLTTKTFDWSQDVQAEVAIGAPGRLPEFEKSVIWTSPEAVNRHDVRCADLSVKLDTLQAIVDNTPTPYVKLTMPQ
jgi:hypothetical protein